MVSGVAWAYPGLIEYSGHVENEGGLQYEAVQSDIHNEAAETVNVDEHHADYYVSRRTNSFSCF